MNKFECLLQKFIQNTITDIQTDCILWTGPTEEYGYGRIYNRATGKVLLVHRVFYTLFTGKRIIGEIDHLCGNKHCVNFEHLEDVSHRENIRRSYQRNPRMLCKRGHKFTPENTYKDKHGKKSCKICKTHQRQRLPPKKHQT